MKLNTIDDLVLQANFIPHEVLKDIDNRIKDWFASGGTEDDPYIQQQLRYAERFL